MIATRLHAAPARSGARRHRLPLALSFAVGLVLALVVTAAASNDSEPPTPFSASGPGASPPAPWIPLRFGERKRPTTYRVASDHGVPVLHARADGSASGLVHSTKIDCTRAPIVQWRWKVSRAIEGANNRVGAREDAPARIVIAFDGDRDKLSLADRTVSYLARKLTSRDLPYATLMYIFSDTAPVGTIISNPYTRRVQMIVVAGSGDGVGQWQALSRNVREDFRRAFGEEPGRIVDVGVMTDTDNTGGSVDAWYGDIRFVSSRH
jgi:DUF3047 family protein